MAKLKKTTEARDNSTADHEFAVFEPGTFRSLV